jgi:hypothetical protein
MRNLEKNCKILETKQALSVCVNVLSLLYVLYCNSVTTVNLWIFYSNAEPAAVFCSSCA